MEERDEYRILTGPEIYGEREFKNEQELERLVVAHEKEVFGEDTVYFDIKHKVSSKLRSRIPDGLLLDLRDRSEPKFWVIEYELISHNLERDVLPQLRGIAKGFENEESLASVRDIVYKEIKSHPNILKRFRELAGADTEVYFKVNEALHEEPRFLLIFDRITDQLADTLDEDLEYDYLVIEFRIFEGKRDSIYLVNPLLPFEDEARTPPSSKAATGRGRKPYETLEQILEVCSQMKVGKSYAEACRAVATIRGITTQTVRDKSTRRIGLTKNEFERHYKDGTLAPLISKRYPEARAKIESALHS